MTNKIRGVVTAPGLNLRPLPNADSPWLDQLNQGDELEVAAVVGSKDWLHVRVVRTGQSGWVAARFVKVTPPTVDVPKPKAPCAPGRGDAERRAVAGSKVGLAAVLLFLAVLVIGLVLGFSR